MAKAKKQALTQEELLEQALVPESEQPYAVPGNWVWTRLDTIAEIVTGGTPSKTNDSYYGGDFPFIKPADLDQGRRVFFASEYLSDNGKEVSRFIPKHSTSVCCIGTIGKCGYLEIDATTNQQINSLIPRIDGLLLYYYCCTEGFVNQLLGLASATTISIVNKGKMSTVPFPLPPLAEQRRIVERIESLFEKLDRAKELAQNALESFETRKAAILHKAFTGELTAQWREQNGVGMDSWEDTKIFNISTVVRGGSPRPAGDPQYYGGNIPFLKVADITRNDSPYVTSAEYSIKKAGLKKTRMVDADTLLLTNSGATLGVPAICTFDTTFNDGIAAFINMDKRSNKFLYYFFIMKTKELRAINMGAAQPNLNTDIIGELSLMLPTLLEQQEIVRILDDLFEKEQCARELCDVIDKIDLMKKAILAHAFRGELGTNDPSEESAVELLKEVLH